METVPCLPVHIIFKESMIGNPDWWVGIGTAVLAVVTAVLAFFTYRLYKAALDARKDSQDILDAAKQSADAASRSSELANLSTRQASDDARATALLELYSAYSNEHYIRARQSAWDLITLCLGSKPYFDFFISTYFPTAYRLEGMPDEVTRDLLARTADIYPKRFESAEKLKEWERTARHDFEDMMNFYSLLYHRLKRAAEQSEHYEFYYDWWRPFFWWVCDEIEASFSRMPQPARVFVSRPSWRPIWQALDEIYGFAAEKTHGGRWIAFKNHPYVKSIGLDERHTSPSFPSALDT